ncbi:DUF4402 domain-containing protein [Sphingomicrobium marinum]|uniref:DUF4402 domain-containing protein n=1 Tax=Sphingomicrobium marinum TaxID=1227950 RepID=UPI00223FB086|nr:DUF4402 domain-containing protein [Sphingomicrobium marinum]
MDQILRFLIGALGATLMLSTPAHAQPVSNSDGRAIAEVLKPLAVVEMSDLDFGTVVTSPLAGTVFIPANGGPPVYTGGVTGVPSDPVMRGEYLVVGDPGRDIIVTWTWPPILSNGTGDTIALLSVNLDGFAVRTLNATNGQSTLHFGGMIAVPADAPEGLYEDFYTVTVDYR